LQAADLCKCYGGIMGRRQGRHTLSKSATVTHDAKDRHGDKRERAVELVPAVRLAATLLEIIWALVRDHVFQGAGH